MADTPVTAAEVGESPDAVGVRLHTVRALSGQALTDLGRLLPSGPILHDAPPFVAVGRALVNWEEL